MSNVNMVEIIPICPVCIIKHCFDLLNKDEPNKIWMEHGIFFKTTDDEPYSVFVNPTEHPPTEHPPTEQELHMSCIGFLIKCIKSF
jgi:hypothetical protein